MSETGSTYRYPYTPYPGASTPPASTTPGEGVTDLWGFFWLSIASSLIIAVAGVATWVVIH